MNSHPDYNIIKSFYRTRYNQWGCSPKSLGWDKGNQSVRFDVLTSHYSFEKKTVLDIGCGFGDLVNVLEKKASCFEYTGIDLSDDFVQRATQLHPDCEFFQQDILSFAPQKMFDYAIASGTFNLKLQGVDQYEFIEEVIKKTLQLCTDGFAFDFLSDKVDYRKEETFHYSPERILSIAYKYSRNVMLRNDYMPFEFSLFLSKDDSFEKHDTLFCKYKNEQNL
ncbi:MAG: class I SAM-dependent methyltransferase [Paludibacteraceae bacterium]|nr:class I SAM-dependent methyltransferase [Paludibacteraceae bacterium]